MRESSSFNPTPQPIANLAKPLKLPNVSMPNSGIPTGGRILATKLSKVVDAAITVKLKRKYNSKVT